MVSSAGKFQQRLNVQTDVMDEAPDKLQRHATAGCRFAHDHAKACNLLDQTSGFYAGRALHTNLERLSRRSPWQAPQCRDERIQEAAASQEVSCSVCGVQL